MLCFQPRESIGMTNDESTRSPTEFILATAIDRVRQQLLGDDSYMGFVSFNSFKAARHRLLREKRRRWTRSHPCLYPGCHDPSVPRSHTLSRSGPLEVIAERGHVLTPDIDTGTL